MRAGTQVPGRYAHSLLIWAQRYGNGREVHLVCAEHPTPRAPKGSQLVRMPDCLSVVPLALPLELLALGVQTVVLHSDGCEQGQALATRMLHWRQLGDVASRSADLRLAARKNYPEAGAVGVDEIYALYEALIAAKHEPGKAARRRAEVQALVTPTATERPRQPRR